MKYPLRAVRERSVLCAIVLAGAILLGAEEWPFGPPDAGRPADDAVGLEESRRIALRHAERMWGTVSAGPVIPCTDLDGKLLARQFIFYRSTGGWISNAAALSRVRAGLEEYRRASAASGVRWGTAAPHISEDARRMRWGIGEFGTIVVSATRNRIPVPERMHGLPPYFTRMDEVLDYLRTAHGITGARLTRVVYLSPVEQWFEFDHRGEPVFVDCQTVRRVDSGRVALLRERCAGRPAAAVRNRLDVLWRDALHER